MGHRFSKTAANNIAATTAKTTTTTTPEISSEQHQQQQQEAFTTTNRISIPNGNNHFVGPTINLQIQESPQQEQLQQQQQFATCNTTTTAAILQHQQQQQSCSSASISSSLTSVNNLSCGGRQIIIKIQLAKMENGNETSTLQQQHHQDTSLESLTADCNLNSSELSTTTTTAAAATVGAQILNLTLNSSNSMPNAAAATTSSSSLSRTAGSSLTKNNNYLNSNTAGAVSCSSTSSSLTTTSNNERLGRFNNTLQFNDEIVEQNIGEIVEYCEVLEEQIPTSSSRSNNNNHMQISSNNGEQDNETNVCCRRKSKSLAANGGSMSSSNNNNNNSTGGAKTKSRCRKCSCRDAFRRILDPSLSRSSNKANKQQQQQQQKEQKRPKSQDRHSNNLLNNNRSIQRHTMHSTTMTNPPTTSAMLQQPPRALATSSSSAAAAASAQQVSLWAPHTANVGDVIIPLTTPQQFVVVQCAIVNPANAPPLLSNALNSTSSISSLPNSIVSLSNDMSSSSTTSSSNDIMVKVPSSSRTPGSNTNATTMGPIVHSQVDFVHYLVPDLERITNSSFYWGKMDRYEAERLLEGKPEGTFLLRDSAQEEFLFSVTFRKYGRSLHARIEQSGHRFSFDCHDPCVFTASTVTGLLEHYKDPACVMFFEPMLTIPLHRKNCFSLQKLCRATIVSNTTYDGINELELPARLKSYLKEYHYKQKLRVKSNEPTYTIHCK